MQLWCVVALLATAAADAGAASPTAVDTSVVSVEVLRTQLETFGAAGNASAYAHTLTHNQTAAADRLQGQQHATSDQLLQLLLQQHEASSQRFQRLQQQHEASDQRLQQLLQLMQTLHEMTDQRLQQPLKLLQKQHETTDQRLRQLQTRINALSGDCATSERRSAPPVRDCSDLPAGTARGVHVLRPDLQTGVPALCHDGWTVLQRRADIQPRQDFFVGWQQYKWGFGSLAGEFWWGLQHMWRLTSPMDRQYQLRIELEDFEGNRRHALYQGFRISSEEDGYRLSVGNYTGDAGDSFSGHSGHRFTTKDKDQDSFKTNCAQMFKGAWWYTNCHKSNLNGLYLAGNHSTFATGVNWKAWKGYHYSLKKVEMKIRPTVKLPAE